MHLFPFACNALVFTSQFSQRLYLFHIYKKHKQERESIWTSWIDRGDLFVWYSVEFLLKKKKASFEGINTEKKRSSRLIQRTIRMVAASLYILTMCSAWKTFLTTNHAHNLREWWRLYAAVVNLLSLWPYFSQQIFYIWLELYINSLSNSTNNRKIIKETDKRTTSAN